MLLDAQLVLVLHAKYHLIVALELAAAFRSTLSYNALLQNILVFLLQSNPFLIVRVRLSTPNYTLTCFGPTNGLTLARTLSRVAIDIFLNLLIINLLLFNIFLNNLNHFRR